MFGETGYTTLERTWAAFGDGIYRLDVKTGQFTVRAGTSTGGTFNVAAGARCWT